MTFASWRAFRDFVQSVRNEMRYVRTPAQEEFLRAVIETSATRTFQVKAGRNLWRAQLGHSWRKDGEEEDSPDIACAHPAERMKPIPEKVADGRANPRGIPCLYLAADKQTAILETRPLIGSYASVALFRTLHDITLVNCADRPMDILTRWFQKTWTPEEIEKAVWSEINEAFSEPVERNDASLDYLPTQILAETFKRQGYGGIAYKSGYGEQAFNIALFDIGAADLTYCELCAIDKVSIEFSLRDSPYWVAKYLSKAEAAAARDSPNKRPPVGTDDAAKRP